jgi:NAD(P)-dependent dehydrogenase (short-subunit alcohol dehydrogenase family)
LLGAPSVCGVCRLIPADRHAVAPMALGLASPEASFVTGAALTIDGGYLS